MKNEEISSKFSFIIITIPIYRNENEKCLESNCDSTVARMRETFPDPSNEIICSPYNCTAGELRLRINKYLKHFLSIQLIKKEKYVLGNHLQVVYYDSDFNELADIWQFVFILAFLSYLSSISILNTLRNRWNRAWF